MIDVPIQPDQNHSDYFRQRADRWRLAASETTDPAARQSCLNLAAQWDELARQTEGQ